MNMKTLKSLFTSIVLTTKQINSYIPFYNIWNEENINDNINSKDTWKHVDKLSTDCSKGNVFTSK